jgi:hypothetical protein
MRNRCAWIVLACAASVTIACGDAAVESLTAPKITATPATPVANQWPTEEEYENAGISSAVGLLMHGSGYFESDYKTFIASVALQFTWSNDVNANLHGWVQNATGQTINSASKGMTWKRFALPVAYGDTTFSVSVSTNNITCGLLGKGTYSGGAGQQLLTIQVHHTSQQATNIADVPQPTCPPGDAPDPGCEPQDYRIIGAAEALASGDGSCDEPAPTPPSGGPNEEVEVCVAVWRQLWLYDPSRNTLRLLDQWFLGVICYTTTLN